MTTTVAERAAGDLGYPGEAWIRDTVTTANGERLTIPPAWYGKYLQITVVGSATVFIRIGDVTVQVDGTTATGGTPPATTPTGKEPHVIVAAGIDAPARIAKALGTATQTQTHLAHVASAAGSKLYIRLATGDGN